MIIIRYFQLCWLILKVILFHPTRLGVRKPRGDIRNFARSFAVTYNLSRRKAKRGT